MRGRYMLGILFILLGLGLLLHKMDVISIGQWWPLLIVLLGLYQLIKGKGASKGGLLLILIGGFILCKIHGLLPDDWGIYIWPAVLIIIGIFILVDGLKAGLPVDNRDHVDYFAAFSGVNARLQSRNFKGGSAVALFGGIELDLKNAEIAEKNATLDLVVMFGGIDIRVPKHWKVEVTGFPLIGGWDNKTDYTPLSGMDEKTLRIKCMVIAGGVDIKN